MTAIPAFPEHARPRAGPTQPGRPGRPALSDRLPHPWLLPLLIFAATWLLILAAWYGSDAIYGHGHPWTWHFLFKDAKYYLAIAEHGYKRTSPFPWGSRGSELDRRAAFFPLLPLLIHLVPPRVARPDRSGPGPGRRARLLRLPRAPVPRLRVLVPGGTRGLE